MHPALSLSEALASSAAGDLAAQDLLGVLLTATVFCEAPDRPGIMSAQTVTGPVVPAYSSLVQLAAARGGVAWCSTSGRDLLGLLPDGHDLLLDPAGPTPTRLRSAALQRSVHVS